MSSASATVAASAPRHRGPRLTLYRYTAREILRPLAFALLGLTAIVLTTRVLEFSELVINRGVEPATVGAILFYEAVPVAARMLPFAVLVASLFALGRMGADREVLALASLGVNPARLAWPIVSFAGVGALAALAAAVWATPWASRSLDAQLAAISREKPWANLRAGTVQRFGGWQLEALEVSPSGDSMRSVMLWTPDVGQTIFAERGRLAAAGGDVDIVLEHGAVVLSREGGVQHVRFDELETRLPAGDVLERKDRDRILGLPLDELALRDAAFVPTEFMRLSSAGIELQRRFAYPFATLVFGFLAVPLFLTRAHASRAAGAVMGLACTLAYYGLVQLSEGLMQAGRVGIALGAWLPNLLLSALAAVLLVRALRERALGKSFERARGGSGRERPERDARGGHEPRLRRRALPRYVAGRFVQVLALSFSVLFSAYLLIDVMDRLDWFAEHGATGLEALRFYGARAPLLASRAVPMAMLVATSLTVSLLAAEGELLGMRACGIPAPRALLPVFAVALLVAPLYFVFNNTVLPRTNALADELKRTEIKDTRVRTRAGVWHRAGRTVIEAELFDPEQGYARGLTVYRLGDDGLPKARIDARAGFHVGGGVWRLEAPSRIDLADGAARRVAARRHEKLGKAVEAEVDTMHLSVAEIARMADETEAGGFDAAVLRTDYHVKLAEPLACIVLPAAVLFFAVTGPPFPGPAQTLLVSAVMGVVYVLGSGVAASLGHGGKVPAALGGWGGVSAMGVVALAFAVRMWRKL